MATAYITRTPAGTGNQKTFTISYWLKRCEWGSGDNFYSQSGGKCYMEFTSGDVLNIGMNTSGTSVDAIRTSRMFRDIGSWYHIVLKMDTTQSTEADRMRLYINGVEEVAANWSTTNYPAQDADILINTTLQYYIGSQTASTNYFNGCMSHIIFTDGTAYAPTSFGEFDATDGMWKIKLSPSVTYGTNGFYLKMEDRTNLDLDSSGNAHTFTTSGTLIATYDNPGNNFPYMNYLENFHNPGPFTNVNGTTEVASSSYSHPFSATMGLSAGLWYWEMRQTTNSAASQQTLTGITGDIVQRTTAAGTELGDSAYEYALFAEDGKIRTNNANAAYGSTAAAQNDIIQCYLDLTANKIYFAVNDTIENSGTGFTITAASLTPAGIYLPAAGYWGAAASFDWNFGNGYFGTTAVTSAVADEGGVGAFEYDPSRGGAAIFDSSAKDFRAICTKNLATYG